MATISLHKFCKDNGIPKTSAYERCKLLDIATRDGLSDDDQQVLLREFGKAVEAEVPTASTEPAAGGLSIHTGNHCTALDVPDFDGLTVDLGQFRDSEALVIEDPLAVADQFLATADMILAGLDSDIAAREQRLKATKQAQCQIATKADELKLEQRLYRLQTSQLDGAQTDETKALADALAQLQSMGKPAADAPTEG